MTASFNRDQGTLRAAANAIEKIKSLPRLLAALARCSFVVFSGCLNVVRLPHRLILVMLLVLFAKPASLYLTFVLCTLVLCAAPYVAILSSTYNLQIGSESKREDRTMLSFSRGGAVDRPRRRYQV